MKFTNALGGCANCGALTSPCWRKGPEEAKHLCNACGSRYLVKGTLEGYKPGLKSRTGGKRPKSGKNKPFPTGYMETSHHSHSDSPQKRLRLFKEQQHVRTFVDKGIQVNTDELQSLAPYTPRDGSEEAYFHSCSPRSHFDRIKQEASEVFHHKVSEGHPHLKDSSDESSPEAEVIAEGKVVGRRRARKPFRPTVSTW